MASHFAILPTSRIEALLQLRQSLGSVAQLILNLFTQFPKCLCVPGRDKEWVVAEPAPPARRKSDTAFARPLEQLSLRFQVISIADRGGWFAF